MIRLFRVFIPTSVVGLLFTETLLIFASYVSVLYLNEELTVDIYLLYEGGLGRIAVVAASLIFGLYLNDLYSNLRVRQHILLFQQFCLVLGVAFLLQALLIYVAPDLTLNRGHMIMGSAVVLVVLPLYRIFYSRIIFEVLSRQTVVFLGSGRLCRRVAAILKDRREFGLDVLGFLSVEDTDAPPAMGQRLGGLDDVERVWRQAKPNLIAIGLDERRGHLPIFQLLELRLLGARVEDVSAIFESLTGRVSVEALRPSSLVFSRSLGPTARQLQWQRLYSFLLAAAGTTLTLPVMLVTAILVKLTSPGPVLYRQSRVGLRGRVFNVYKFRSMRSDAEAETGAVWAAKDDPRITPLGRWLRRLRIDELPQFFNVLRGEMAIVGPRPERPEFVSTLSEQIPFYGQRHAALPGITGWAQINHKYGDTLEDTIQKLEYDLYYLKNMSLALDMYIMFHTLKVMLLRRGAQ